MVSSWLEDGKTKLLPGNGAFDFEYADDITLMNDIVQANKHTLNRLTNEVSSDGMCFELSKSKID